MRISISAGRVVGCRAMWCRFGNPPVSDPGQGAAWRPRDAARPQRALLVLLALVLSSDLKLLHALLAPSTLAKLCDGLTPPKTPKSPKQLKSLKIGQK
eukprot:599477-Amphidinium_carterae.1